MQYIDSNTNPGRFPDDVDTLLEAMLANKQIRYVDQEDPPPVTQAIKYERKRQQRRKTSPYSGSDSFVESIVDIFGFDPLDFQVTSWQLIDRMAQTCSLENQSKAAVLSAPTGFGKTEAFLGPLYQLLRSGRQDSVAIVYPRRALLQDQLGRVLEHVHSIKQSCGDQLSVGCYVGNMAWNLSDVGDRGFFHSGDGRKRFTPCNCWCSSDGQTNSFELHQNSESYFLQCENDSTHRFTQDELVLARKEMVFEETPDIVLTTLESMENFAHKPHYDLLDNFGTIVLDEVHLNTGLRGAHAAKIIQNVDDISSGPLLWVGSSATIDDPARFGQQIFGLESVDIVTTAPPPSDFDDTHDDHEHYYFMIAREDGPGVTSMSIQQSMLLGHTMLASNDGSRAKQLSFIDSISQINQQRVQLEDADRTNQLWEFHLNDEFEEDWQRVATAMGQRFIDEPLSFMPVYSEEGFDRERASESDILLSTNFLEVGIDVGDIKLVTQHRTPWNLSSFLQRAGRAARKPGMDSHVAVYLSTLTGDANMFYRADRFLASDIRTPVNTNNRVVEWMHERFNRYYHRLNDISGRTIRSDLRRHTTFLEEYLCDDLGYETYYEMLLEPRTFFEERLGVEVDSNRLISPRSVDEVRNSLQQYKEQQREDVADIEVYFDMDGGDVVRGVDSVETFVLEVQEQTLRTTNTFDGQVSGFAAKLDAEDANEYQSMVERLQTSLADIRSSATDVPDDNGEAVQLFGSLVADLYQIMGQLMGLRQQANVVADQPVPQVDDGEIQALKSVVTQLETLTEDDRLEAYYTLEEQIYYLDRALDEYASYLDSPGSPYNSLFRVKDLLRGAYYVDRFLRTVDEQLGDTVWFVPPDYFGGAGQFVTIQREGSTGSRPEESMDQIVSTYSPYRSEYQSESGVMHAFLPRTEVTEDGVVMEYTGDVAGEEHDGLLVPDTISLTEIRDLSGQKAMEMVRYCPECFQILPNLDSCLRHDTSAYGKIHSEPHIDTTVTDRTPVESRGDLTLADLKAQVTLESVTLEITPGQDAGPDIGVIYASEGDRVTQELQSPDIPLGFTTQTRGLVFDMDGFLDGLEDKIGDLVRRYHDTDDYSLEFLAYHTAAHFFLQLVTDVSSVTAQRVFYGYDQHLAEVYVFERTEGGQGIVDLVYQEIESDPGSVLESMHRLLYNEQVINERLWADQEFVAALPIDDISTSAIETVVFENLAVPFDDVVERVTEEVVATVDQAHQLAIDQGIEHAASYALKHTVAAAQVRGCNEFPAAEVDDHPADIADYERVRTAFYSPDIDGCVENLHLMECIATDDQSETLSYILLEALRDYLLEMVNSEDAANEMFDREQPPGGETDGTSVFLNL
ncbi:DEAD/DEAH box helicase [Halococcoides cellulosivorans]|uniref:DEAD/DEAH box helicase n=1 Tax=Halococcoides cellulosivorans TaxID=1679096 RepID=A0A2R4X495_9EURY|nr:DEAD/DEAH box helicase [Halococcoides cellulosivorans]AWB28523.1 DEAD/DEAH box helicase [Halococcoides cellulosivorans]